MSEKIEKLQRYELINSSVVPYEKGKFVLASPAAARERVLVKALKDLLKLDGCTLRPEGYERVVQNKITEARLDKSTEARCVLAAIERTA